MGISGAWARGAMIMTVALGSVGVTGRGQVTTQQQAPGQIPSASQQSTNPMHRNESDDDGLPKDIAAKQARAREDDRQRRLVTDTDKLLALATSLHEDVAKTNKNVMSLDVVRRAEEIEKLARSVKERMKG